MYPHPTADYLASLTQSHHVYVEIVIMDINQQPISNASTRLISGQVDMDAQAHITRSGKVQLWDPYNDLGLGLAGATQFTRMIQVNYWTKLIFGGSWHRTALATCVITDVSRDGGIANVEFKGKEVLADHAMHTTWIWPPGWHKSSVIMNAMTNFTGETWAFWDHTGSMHGNMLNQYWGMDPGENLWGKLKDLAASYGANLYYNGEGILCITPIDVTPRFTITPSYMTSEPSFDYSMDNLINMVRVEGAMAPTWDGGEVRIVYEAWPPAWHHFSPQMLARNGWPRVIPLVIRDEQIPNFDVAATVAWSTSMRLSSGPTLCPSHAWCFRSWRRTT